MPGKAESPEDNKSRGQNSHKVVLKADKQWEVAPNIGNLYAREFYFWSLLFAPSLFNAMVRYPVEQLSEQTQANWGITATNKKNQKIIASENQKALAREVAEGVLKVKIPIDSPVQQLVAGSRVAKPNLFVKYEVSFY